MKKTLVIILILALVTSIVAFAAPGGFGSKGSGTGTYEGMKNGAGRGARDFTEVYKVLGITAEEAAAARLEGKTLHEIAEEKGLVEEFNAVMTAGLKEKLQVLVDAGKITQEQADERVAEAAERMANGEYPGRDSEKERLGGRGHGKGTKDGMKKGAGRGQRDFTEVYEVLGITAEEAAAARLEGKKLHEIAEEKGLLEEFNAVMTAGLKEKLQVLVDAGKITQEQADERVAGAAERMENGEYPGRDADKERLGGGLGKKGPGKR